MNIETTVGEIVRAAPARSRIFENLGIDYCCGGKKPLAEACQAKGLDPATVVAMLSALDGAPDAATADVNAMTLSELCDHIQSVHHSYLREELPRLDFMTRKVAAVHGEHEPRLLEVRRVFEPFQAEMISHTNEEDETVFPAVRQLESAEGSGAAGAANLQAMFAKLESEHEKAGAALARFRELTDNYTPPEWACNTFRALYDGLEQLEKRTHQHVHTENNVLFPKALAKAALALDSIPEVKAPLRDDWSRRSLAPSPSVDVSPSSGTVPSRITHNVQLQRFESRAGDSPLAFLSYTREGDRVVLDHTFVPEELRGRGTAAALARAALNEARQQGWRIVPRCSYVARFIKRNPEFAGLLDDLHQRAL